MAEPNANYGCKRRGDGQPVPRPQQQPPWSLRAVAEGLAYLASRDQAAMCMVDTPTANPTNRGRRRPPRHRVWPPPLPAAMKKPQPGHVRVLHQWLPLRSRAAQVAAACIYAGQRAHRWLWPTCYIYAGENAAMSSTCRALEYKLARAERCVTSTQAASHVSCCATCSVLLCPLLAW
jgi:hypothetical protein